MSRLFLSAEYIFYHQSMKQANSIIRISKYIYIRLSINDVQLDYTDSYTTTDKILVDIDLGYAVT